MADVKNILPEVVTTVPPPPPVNSIVYVAQPPPHVPPPPNETPPGGKFGIKDVNYEDGKRIETVRFVNAHNLPFTDDADENLKADLKDRGDLKGKK